MPPQPQSGSARRDMTPSLVARLRDGDGDVGDMLNKLYRDPMLRFCSTYLGSMDEAEDAVQEVFVKVLRSPEIPDNFRTWIYKIARNFCIDTLRKRARRKDGQSLPLESHLEALATGIASLLAKQEFTAQLVQMVRTLSLAHREVLQLRYGEGLARAEIADVLDLPESVVKSRIYEGLKKLRQQASGLDNT